MFFKCSCKLYLVKFLSIWQQNGVCVCVHVRAEFKKPANELESGECRLGG